MSASGEWTPGPWRIVDDGERLEVRSDAALVLGGRAPNPAEVNMERMTANLLLIAAAPEMAELLQLWANDSDAYPGTPGLDEATRTLLARIQGEP